MKNLSYFLWLCVVGLAGYVAYFFLTTTNFREKDLAVVGQQNRVLITTTYLQQQYSYEYVNDMADIIKRQGTSLVDAKILNQVNNIYHLTKKYDESSQISHQQRKYQEIVNSYKTYCQVISSLDTFLHELKNIQPKYTPSHLLNDVFISNYCLSIKNNIAKTEAKAIWQILNRMGCGLSIQFEQIKSMACPHRKVVNENDTYEAVIVLVSNELSDKQSKISITRGNLTVLGHEGTITIPYTPLQFDTSGQSKQTVNGKVSIKPCFLKDTTIYLSTTYTIKRKK